MAAEARVPTFKILNDMFDKFKRNKWVDATTTIKKSRVVKSPQEQEQLRITSEVTCIGLEHARHLIKPGVQESFVAGRVEGNIYGMGIGYKNVTRARGYCFVMSGDKFCEFLAAILCSIQKAHYVGRTGSGGTGCSYKRLLH